MAREDPRPESLVGAATNLDESQSNRVSSDHPWRMALIGEIHARPYPEIHPPAHASHLALVSGEAAAETERRHVALLCERYGAAAPAPGVIHFSHDFGAFRLRWERHTEFSTYSFFTRGPFAAPFEDPPIDRVPRDWLDGLVGSRLVAVHVALQDRSGPDLDDQSLAHLFAGNAVVGGKMLGGGALAWTDFHVHADGFNRIVIRDIDMLEGQAGRLLQRLLEIETYRMMALLALPVARAYGPQVAEIESNLTLLMGRISVLEEPEEEHKLLDELSRLAANLERIVAENSYRFGAARAYHALVTRRMDELRERRAEGRQPLGNFLERRLAPAMRTCESLVRRQHSLSGRVARASDMLRTRVNIELERQNRDLLASMNRRARLQIRLQQTVEGISVVAITY